MTQIEIDKFKNDFLQSKGFDLASNLRTYHYLGNNATDKASLFINRVEQMVMLKIEENNKLFDISEASTYQKNAIWEAELEQGLYLLMSGDVTLISGYDPTTSNLIPIDELRMRWFSPLAEKKLLRAGLLYRGIVKSTRSIFPYDV